MCFPSLKIFHLGYTNQQSVWTNLAVILVSTSDDLVPAGYKKLINTPSKESMRQI